MLHIVFWQPIPSFHQESLMNALASLDCVESVTLLVESAMGLNRLESGWRSPTFHPKLKQQLIQPGEVPVNKRGWVHIFTGLDTHPLIWQAFHLLNAQPRLCCCLAYAEAPELYGAFAYLRRIKYRLAGWRVRAGLDGVLALGYLGQRFYSGIFGSKIKVVEYGYYDHMASELPSLAAPLNTDREFRFLYVGQCIQRKGVDRLLRALSRLPEGNWYCDLIGEGPQRVDLMALADRLGLSKRVKWHGTLPNADLGHWYQQADCVVIPSRWDGWGMAGNEGLRYGCRVLATHTCGVVSVLPKEDCLPHSPRRWTSFLSDVLAQGSPSLQARQQQQRRAISVSGEVGASNLLSFLHELKVPGVPPLETPLSL